MQLRKTVSSKHELSKIDELINHIQKLEYPSNVELEDTILNTASIHQYFTNLHQLISAQNIHHYQRLQNINDGIYVLLKGQISYALNQLQHDSKLTLTKTSWNKCNNINSIIKEPLSVFECHLKNCTALEETILLKIKEDQAINSKFYQLYNRRHDLYEKQFLSYDHIAVLGVEFFDKVFLADLNIHSNFRYKSYTFRQEVCLSRDYVGVIAEGKVKLKHQASKLHQFGKYGVLLPHLFYEISSAEMVLMLVHLDETVNLRVNLAIFEGKQNSSHLDRAEKKTRIIWFKQGKKKSQKLLNGLQLDSKKEQQKREKYLNKISKQSEQYSIISTYLSNQSLNYAKKYNQNHNTKHRKNERIKHPTFLFETHQQKCPKNFSASLCSPTKTEHISELGVRSGEGDRLSLLRRLRWPVQIYEKKMQRQRLQKKNRLQVRWQQQQSQDFVRYNLDSLQKQ